MRGCAFILNGVSTHTGNDLDLVQERKEIGAPEVQFYTVEVPGRNGVLDLTKSLTGRTTFFNRKINFRYFASGTLAEILEKIDTLMMYHGETVRIIDDDTPAYYYEGSVVVEVDRKPAYAYINLEVDAQPFRMKLEQTENSYTLTETETEVEIVNPGYAVTPEIVVSDTCVIAKGDTSFNLTAGTYSDISALILEQGSNVYTVSGSGTVNINYREARI